MIPNPGWILISSILTSVDKFEFKFGWPIRTLLKLKFCEIPSNSWIQWAAVKITFELIKVPPHNICFVWLGPDLVWVSYTSAFIIRKMVVSDLNWIFAYAVSGLEKKVHIKNSLNESISQTFLWIWFHEFFFAFKTTLSKGVNFPIFGSLSSQIKNKQK